MRVIILELMCGLMIEAAKTDGIVDEVEITRIKSILINTFKKIQMKWKQL